MDIKVEKFTFYNDGGLYTNNQRHIGKRQYIDEPEKASLSILVVGTHKQIDKALRDYIKKHNLALDEAYEIKPQKEYHDNGVYNLQYYGEEHNVRLAQRIQILKNRYIKNNKKTLIL